MAIDINRLWSEKTEKLSGKVKAIARGDDDFYQQGLLGIREGLLRDPYATDSYLLQAARYSMSNYRNRGRSVDNGSRHATTKRLLDGTVRTYRKDMAPIHIDKLVSEFRLEFPGYSHRPDLLALDKVCADEFYGILNEEESELVYACILTLDGRSSDSNARKELGIDKMEYNRIKQSAYEKFIRAFGTDEQIEAYTRD